MINTILATAQNIIGSPSLLKTFSEIQYTFSLSEDDLAYLKTTTNAVLLGKIPEKDFVSYFIDGSDIKKDMGQRIYEEVKIKILNPFKQRVAEIVKNHPEEAAKIIEEKIQNKASLRDALPFQPQQRIETLTQTPFPESQANKVFTEAKPLYSKTYTTKEAILNEIENPPRTTIKRYVVEYDHEPKREPLNDTSHLIGNKRDETLKLQDHYND